jgi:hypothetical protein
LAAPKPKDYYLRFLPSGKIKLELFPSETLIKKKGDYMKKELKLKKFKSEDHERKFWSKVDLAKHFTLADFEVASLPNLKPTSRAISLRLPEFVINRAKRAGQ